jgi:hypothetical protein
LKFGIHIMRGVPRQAAHQATAIENSPWTARDIAHPNSICPWNTDMYGTDPEHPGTQDYYDSLFRLYAKWGVDFVKIDDLAASRLYGPHIGELKVIRTALGRCGRPMVLSLSPRPASVELAHIYRELANMWRITDDFWDRWDLLKDMFDRCERWYSWVGPESWPDCDMLPLGHIGIRSSEDGASNRESRFTREEQQTMMSLWALFRSPLMLGCELRDLDPWTLALVTNKEVLAINQKGANPRPVTIGGIHRVWCSVSPEGSHSVGLFNLGEEVQQITVTCEQLGISGSWQVQDLWQSKALGAFDLSFTALVPPHGTLLVELAPA